MSGHDRSTNGKQRYNAGRRCPSCGGADADPRGESRRCHGFISEDGLYAHCSREEHSPGCNYHPDSQTYSHILSGKCHCGKEHGPASMTRSKGPKPKANVVCRYTYKNEDGSTSFQVERLEPKGFRQRKPNADKPGGWEYSTKGIKTPIYRLPELRKSDETSPIFITEGEKSADRLAAAGLLATCSPMGAGKFRDHHADYLAGRDIIIVPDNDQAGREHGEQVARKCQGKASSIRVLSLQNLPPGGDVWDWMEISGTPEEHRTDLLAMAAELDEWEPPQAAEPPSPSQNDHPSAIIQPPTIIVPRSRFEGMNSEDKGLRRFDTWEAKHTDWIWKYRIAAGKLTLLAGEGGLGKSQVSLAIAAAISRGAPWPDGQGNAPLGDVLIVSAEDEPEDDILPRLIALGADVTRLYLVQPKYVIRKEGKPNEIHYTSFRDLEYWNSVLDDTPHGKLMIADPMPSFLGGVKENDNAEVRSVLELFMQEVIAPRRMGMMGVMHLNKGGDNASPSRRIMGSSAFNNLARNVHFAVNDPDVKGRKIFAQAKTNKSPGDLPALAYRIETAYIPDPAGGPDIETSRPVFEVGPAEVDLHRALSGGKAAASGQGRGRPSTASPERATWLWNRLNTAGDWVRLGDLIAEAGEAGWLGHQDDDGKWSGIKGIYRAQEYVPQLTEEHAHSWVDSKKFPGASGKLVTYWRLVTPTKPPSGEAPGMPGEPPNSQPPADDSDGWF